jgi:hypothetical protein
MYYLVIDYHEDSREIFYGTEDSCWAHHNYLMTIMNRRDIFSLSAPRELKKEIMFYCKHCGKPLFKGRESVMSDEELCFTCDFWLNDHNLRTDRNVTVDGTVYWIGEEPTEIGYKPFLGHGGSLFRIEKFSGEKISTTNLWCRGRVPARFKDLYPDNAKFY